MSNRVQVERMRLSPQSTASARPVDTYVGVENVGKTKTAQLMEALGVGVKTAAKSIEEYDKLELINQQAKARSFMNTYKDSLAQAYMNNPNMTQEEAIASLGEGAQEEYNSLTEGFALDRTRDVFKGHMESVIGSNLAAMQQDGLRVQMDNKIAEGYAAVFTEVADQVALNGRMLPSVEKEKYAELLQPSISALEKTFKDQGMSPAQFKTGFLQQAKLEAANGNPYLAQYIVDKGLYSPDERAALQNLATNASNRRIAEQRDQFAQEIFQLREAVTGANATALNSEQQAMLDEFLAEGIVSREFATDIMTSGVTADERRQAEIAKENKKAQAEALKLANESTGTDALIEAERAIEAEQALDEKAVGVLEVYRDQGFISNAQYKSIMDKNNKLLIEQAGEGSVRAELERYAAVESLIGETEVVIEEIGNPVDDAVLQDLLDQALALEDKSLVNSALGAIRKNNKAKIDKSQASTLGPILASGQLSNPAYEGVFTAEQKQQALTNHFQTTASNSTPAEALISTAKLAAKNGIKFDYIKDQFQKAMTFGVTDLQNEDAINQVRQAVDLYRDLRMNGMAGDYFSGLTPKLQKLKTVEAIMAHRNVPVAEAMATVADLEARDADEVFNDRWAVMTTAREDAAEIMKDLTGAGNVDFLLDPMSRMYAVFRASGFDHDAAMTKAGESIADDFVEVEGQAYPKGAQGAIAFAEKGGDGVYEFFTQAVEAGKLESEQVDILLEDLNYDEVYFKPVDTVGSAYMLAEKETGLPVTGMQGFLLTNNKLAALALAADDKTFGERVVEIVRKANENVKKLSPFYSSKFGE